MSSSLSDSVLEKKFQGATNTQDSIQTLSLWLLHHKAHHQKIVSSWMKVLQKAKINHRLTLFHLANDVVQNSKRRGFTSFVNSFAEVLKEATLLVRDEHIRPAILRVFNIWEQRNIYSPEFIADLRAILANSKVPATAPSKLLADFKPDTVIKKIRLVSSLQTEVNQRLASINLSKLNATNAEIVQNLKDRVHGQQFKRDFDKNVALLEELVDAMTKTVAAQTELILLLEQSEIYYDTQRGEAKVVANAYKNFDNRVKTLQKKLAELAATFPSPVPSPSVDAPSPTTSDHELELNLPTDNSNKQSGMSSWLDAFAAKKDKTDILPVKTEPKQSDSGSLDSRLSNLLQNIPNLPSGLQSTLFGGSTTAENNTPLRETTESPITTKKDKVSESLNSGALTPVKDEYSGQNTPLQDEDMHSSHSYFTKLASSNKTQSPKDILKGLTNLIQSANADKEDSQRKEKFSPFVSSELYDQSGGMSTFIKSIIPSISQSSQHLSSPSSYFTTSQSALPASVSTLSSTLTTTVNSYQTTTFNSIPSYSTQSTVEEQQLSYIPSLVPSTPIDNFKFSNKSFSVDEYNPELETYNTDMDLEDPMEEDNIDVPSPEMEPLSPVRTVSIENDVPRVTIPTRRLSTLITVVTDDTPSQVLPSDKNAQENGAQESMPIWPASVSAPIDSSNSMLSMEPMKDSPNEEFFIGKPPETNAPSYFSTPPPPPPNGDNVSYIEPISSTTDSSLSRIETVQSQRENLSNRWFGNSWHNNSVQNLVPSSPEGQFPVHHGPPPSFFNQNRNFSRPNFQPRQNWSPRFRPNRPEMFQQKRPQGSFNPRPGQYGSSSNKRFPFRGRGRGWNQSQY
ncbi:regulation of nuclear pre-mRNA domain-containing protein 2-like isoform X2 [Argiope bruennichi]|uniref:Regulation of nuclear pre-mRNA domain-containing protein 2 n=1 Tax=Argiope bruennichi TaxID=94029 RepID=A0A8T0FW40_ARGBR|nr:regulation of nuclear pre-mRNA domain-containing protein 2-like isoform X2 [Argiope bruennichi]KAF8792983.1 Regulation of nuclear pre-mRNA like protein [Argiope bruennichi]